MKKFELRLLTAILSSAAIPAIAMAQTSPTKTASEPDATEIAEASAGQAATPNQDIIVTGSRIARRDYSAPSPIVTTSSDSVTNSTTVTLENVMNELPQFVGSYTGSTAFPGNAGQANLNLRGLGTNRVLVLLDGRRLQPTSPDGAVDVNILPSGLIQSVETITGGASATYGSDAVAGVVNFKLNTRFRGVRIDAKQVLTTRGDGSSSQVEALAGTSFADDRGSIILSASYAKRARVKRRARSYFPDDLTQVGTAPVFAANTLVPQGAAVLASGPPSQAAVDAVFAQYGAAPGAARASDAFGINHDGTLFTSAPTSRPVLNYRGPIGEFSAPYRNGIYSNSNLRIDLQLPLERVSTFGRAEFEPVDGLTLFAQGYYVDYTVGRELAEAPIGGLAGSVLVPVTNPFIPADLRTLLASRANAAAPFLISKGFTQIPTRTEANHYVAWQSMGGVRGELGGGWNWDATVSYGRNSLNQRETSANRQRVQALLNAADGGASLCAGGFNPFGDNALSAACVDYISASGVNRTRLAQTTAEANVQGALFDLPGGAVQLAAGVGHRTNSYGFTPDPLISGGNLIGFSGASSSSGKQRVNEVYVELLAPLLADLPLIEKLELGAAYRYSHYKGTGGVSTYRVNLDWRVGGGLSLRGGYSRAVRAPSLSELYGASVVASTTIGDASNGSANGDPCDFRSAARTGPNAAQVAALCLAQGVPAASLATFSQVSVAAATMTSGNLALKPEEADTYSIGAVLQPSGLGGAFANLRLSVDYYRIKIGNAVGVIPVSQSLIRCFNYDGSNPTYSNANVYCGNIRRTPGLGSLSVPSLQPQLNLAGYSTAGIDGQIDWSIPLGSNRLNLNLVGTYLDHFRVTALPGAPVLDYTGTTTNGSASGAAVPRFKSVSSIGFVSDNVTATVKWRHISALRDSSLLTNPASTVRGVKAYDYFDASVGLRVENKFRLTFGVTNLADKAPPVIGGALGAFDYSTYDTLGRTLFLGVSADF